MRKNKINIDKKVVVYDIPELDVQVIGSEQLQRTEQWFLDRKGMFTGSTNSKLMGCTQSYSKKPWGDTEKLLHFSETAIKHVYEKAQERLTGVIVELQDNLNFKYGRKAEPIIVSSFEQKYKGSKFIEKGFLTVKGHEKYLGASPDGECIGIIKVKDESFGFEAKGAMNWGTYYERMEKPLDEKHMDFWQVQTEMLALDVKKLIYATSFPVKNAIDFVRASEVDADQMIKQVKFVTYNASPIHQEALIQRAAISHNAIELYIAGINFHEAINKACTEFEI